MELRNLDFDQCDYSPPESQVQVMNVILMLEILRPAVSARIDVFHV